MAFVAPILGAVIAGGGAAAAGAGIGAALTVGATALTGISQYQEAKYKSYVARNNAKIAEQNAIRETESAQKQQLRSDREYAATIASQLAEQSASGLDALSASQMRVRAATARVGREAAGDIRRQGEYDTQKYQQEAANFRSESKMLKSKMITDIAGTLIGGARSIRKDGWKN